MLETEIKQRITAQFSTENLEVINESAMHAGHAGIAGDTSGETHFRIIVQSDELNALTRVKAHQQIYNLLDDLMNNPIHALAIELKKQ